MNGQTVTHKMLIPNHDDGPEAFIRLPVVAGREHMTWAALPHWTYRTWHTWAQAAAQDQRDVEAKNEVGNED